MDTTAFALNSLSVLHYLSLFFINPESSYFSLSLTHTYTLAGNYKACRAQSDRPLSESFGEDAGEDAWVRGKKFRR